MVSYQRNHLQTIDQQLEAILKNTLLQILKNTLIAIIQQKVLAWVQGSGAPRFITNWGATLVNAAQTNAINAINRDMNFRLRIFRLCSAGHDHAKIFLYPFHE